MENAKTFSENAISDAAYKLAALAELLDQQLPNAVLSEKVAYGLGAILGEIALSLNEVFESTHRIAEAEYFDRNSEN
jgi:hypothetical protein